MFALGVQRLKPWVRVTVAHRAEVGHGTRRPRLGVPCQPIRGSHLERGQASVCPLEGWEASSEVTSADAKQGSWCGGAGSGEGTCKRSDLPKYDEDRGAHWWEGEQLGGDRLQQWCLGKTSERWWQLT